MKFKFLKIKNLFYKYIICYYLYIFLKLKKGAIAYNCWYGGFGHEAWEIAFGQTLVNTGKFNFIIHPVGDSYLSNPYLIKIWGNVRGLIVVKSNFIKNILQDCTEHWPKSRIDIGNTPKKAKNLTQDEICSNRNFVLKAYQQLIKSNHAIVKNRIDGFTPMVSIPSSDKAMCLKSMSNLGLKEDDWFVCIHAREDTSYNLARSNDIEIYLKAAEFIREKGGKVVRIGNKDNQRVNKNQDDTIIDYSCSKYNNRMNDIFLLKNQKMLIGSQSGPAQVVESLFNIPVIMIGVSQWARIGLHHNDFYTLNLFSDKHDKIFSVHQYIQSGLHLITCGAYDQNINVIKNDKDDVYNVVKEAYNHNFSDKQECKCSISYNKLFTNKFPKNTPTYYLNSKLSSHFISKNKAVLFPEE